MNDEAMKELRLGELKNALRIVVAEVVAEVEKTVPCYTAILKMFPSGRKDQLAVALQTAARLLDVEAEQLRRLAHKDREK